MLMAAVTKYVAGILALIVLSVMIRAAAAAGYPERPVRLIVPSAPGGGTDTSARIIAPKLSEYLGQQVIIDNRAGAGAIIGAELVSRAPPDEYSLLIRISQFPIHLA